MSNKLINRCSNDDSIFLVDENLQMSFGCENREDRRNDARSIAQLSLSDFIQTQGAKCIWNGLKNLDTKLSRWHKAKCRENTSMEGSIPVSIAL